MVKTKYYQAILELSAEKSLAAISVRDISNHLGISTGSLYYQFSGKNDLLNQMFRYYKNSLGDYIENLSDDPTALLNSYLDYSFAHNLEFRFVYSSELSNLLDRESLEVSLNNHKKILKKLNLEYGNDAHITTIVFGTMRAYLMAPSYMLQCNQVKLVDELVNIINRHKETSN